MNFDSRAKPASGNPFCGGCNWHGAAPAEDPIGFVGAHVDTTVAHGRAEIFVPVGAVKGMPLPGEEGRPWYAGQNIVINVGKNIACGLLTEVTIPHMLCGDFIKNGELARGGGGGNARAAGWVAGDAGGNVGLENQAAIFIGVEHLA
ncbi:MAG: hypothetical protein RIR73_1422 [Chloroflexota bacterium]